MNHSVRRLSRLARELQLKSYLEIGVKYGRTFNNFNLSEKDAVDPKFMFDTRPYEKELIRFFSVTSDEFFLKFHNNKKYDLIFIDGLHTFEQTFRDFCSALSAMHDNTIIILDDVYPSDIFSAHPNQDSTYLFRDRHDPTKKERAWHGDVYKVIFAIHDFFSKSFLPHH